MSPRRASHYVLVLVLLAGSVTLLSQSGTIDVQVLAINDLHGTLQTPAGGAGRIGSTEVGGVEYLAAHLARLRAGHPYTITVSAGDNIGASPFMSGLFHDEPTIEALNAAGLELSAVGNHELDEGWSELARMQDGGCHPRDGCQDGTPFGGAAFRFLAANIEVDPARAAPPQPFAPYAVREFDGVKIGFIGLTLHTVPDIVSAPGIAGLSFADEARAGNVAAAALRRQGVRAIVALIHEGGRTASQTTDMCRSMSGALPDILRRFSPDIDVVVSGHTHRAYVCMLRRTLVTSADAFGRLITDIDLRLDRRTGRIVAKSASNVLVTRDVSRDERVSSILTHYAAFVDKEAARVVGSIVGPISRVRNAAGESPLGDVVADGMLWASNDSQKGGAAFALMNPGGIRTDLVRGAESGEPAGPVTYADLYRVLPFGNQLLVQTLSGDAIRRLLEQQFDNPTPGSDTILQVSANFTYTYRRSRPPGQRVEPGSMRLNGAPIDLRNRYRVVMPDFVWSGGDRFSVAMEGTDVAPAIIDIDALSSYAQSHAPISPGPADRIRREP
jgi:5'-nucleotidase